MNNQDIFSTVLVIAEKYGANTGINLKDNHAIIRYHRLENGSEIVRELEGCLPKSLDYTLKLIPSDLKIEFKITPNLVF